MIAISARRALRLTHTADIKRIPANAVSASDRETMTAGVACSAVYPASTEQAERAGMATAARLMVVYCENVTVQNDWRFVADGVDYRIRTVSAWPQAAPAFIELLIERES
jgi:SPP1 family predicted phage head-tail adaptor